MDQNVGELEVVHNEAVCNDMPSSGLKKKSDKHEKTEEKPEMDIQLDNLNAKEKSDQVITSNAKSLGHTDKKDKKEIPEIELLSEVLEQISGGEKGKEDKDENRIVMSKDTPANGFDHTKESGGHRKRKKAKKQEDKKDEQQEDKKNEQKEGEIAVKGSIHEIQTGGEVVCIDVPTCGPKEGPVKHKKAKKLEKQKPEVDMAIENIKQVSVGEQGDASENNDQVTTNEDTSTKSVDLTKEAGHHKKGKKAKKKKDEKKDKQERELSTDKIEDTTNTAHETVSNDIPTCNLEEKSFTHKKEEKQKSELDVPLERVERMSGGEKGETNVVDQVTTNKDATFGIDVESGHQKKRKKAKKKKDEKENKQEREFLTDKIEDTTNTAHEMVSNDIPTTCILEEKSFTHKKEEKQISELDVPLKRVGRMSGGEKSEANVVDQVTTNKDATFDINVESGHQKKRKKAKKKKDEKENKQERELSTDKIEDTTNTAHEMVSNDIPTTCILEEKSFTHKKEEKQISELDVPLKRVGRMSGGEKSEANVVDQVTTNKDATFDINVESGHQKKRKKAKEKKDEKKDQQEGELSTDKIEDTTNTAHKTVSNDIPTTTTCNLEEKSFTHKKKEKQKSELDVPLERVERMSGGEKGEANVVDQVTTNKDATFGIDVESGHQKKRKKAKKKKDEKKDKQEGELSTDKIKDMTNTAHETVSNDIPTTCNLEEKSFTHKKREEKQKLGGDTRLEAVERISESEKGEANDVDRIKANKDASGDHRKRKKSGKPEKENGQQGEIFVKEILYETGAAGSVICNDMPSCELDEGSVKNKEKTKQKKQKSEADTPSENVDQMPDGEKDGAIEKRNEVKSNKDTSAEISDLNESHHKKRKKAKKQKKEKRDQREGESTLEEIGNTTYTEEGNVSNDVPPCTLEKKSLTKNTSQMLEGDKSRPLKVTKLVSSGEKGEASADITLEVANRTSGGGYDEGDDQITATKDTSMKSLNRMEGSDSHRKRKKEKKQEEKKKQKGEISGKEILHAIVTPSEMACSDVTPCDLDEKTVKHKKKKKQKSRKSEVDLPLDNVDPVSAGKKGDASENNDQVKTNKDTSTKTFDLPDEAGRHRKRKKEKKQTDEKREKLEGNLSTDGEKKSPSSEEVKVKSEGDEMSPSILASIHDSASGQKTKKMKKRKCESDILLEETENHAQSEESHEKKKKRKKTKHKDSLSETVKGKVEGKEEDDRDAQCGVTEESGSKGKTGRVEKRKPETELLPEKLIEEAEGKCRQASTNVDVDIVNRDLIGKTSNAGAPIACDKTPPGGSGVTVSDNKKKKKHKKNKREIDASRVITEEGEKSKKQSHENPQDQIPIEQSKVNVDLKDGMATAVSASCEFSEQTDSHEKDKKTKKRKHSGEVISKNTEEKTEMSDSQWATAEFSNVERKEKFLRLMGAFKPSSKEQKTTYSTKAMNEQQQKAFVSSLDEQFSSALQRRKDKGVGLGYH
ncbi:E3 ubiquitin-protein ligase RBBP6-like isoform X2 [Dendronephthya gigantea]|uniref:E3 ubiquitin-protein ligase RBBP6-like isoform X2 n=1 Tax=Dendronephthya gigantea TaxID=151771 RepID=UPI00106920CA|nr:E3 ubiquitin-protein ligase RBBP6-like isoform X2 [Dendronephthya gigantea]